MSKLVVALFTLIGVSIGKAVLISGAAFPVSKPGSVALPQIENTIPFRTVRGRGLLVSVWINRSHPFTFALDSGAGASIIAQRVADEVQLPVRSSNRTLLGGLSTSPITSNREATLASMSLGDPTNTITRSLVVAISPNLPGGLDGILDPLEISPYGYSIDLVNHQLVIFKSRQGRLSAAGKPEGGAVVRWIRQPGDQRPFVRLGDGRLALLDTGSNFGLAVSEDGGRNHGREGTTVGDLGGGTVQTRRAAPTNINIGELELRNIPTDVLTGVAPGTPVILGRDALAPFKLTFDPIARLIEIVPANGERD